MIDIKLDIPQYLINKVVKHLSDNKSENIPLKEALEDFIVRAIYNHLDTLEGDGG